MGDREVSIYEKELKGCRRCSLYMGAHTSVPGRGDKNAAIMLIGEAPGLDEDMAGEPFVGKSGKILQKMLDTAGLSRSSLYITNIIKHRPPNNRKPTKAEIKACSVFINDEIRSVSPKEIVALGGTAFHFFFPEDRLTEQIGHVLEWHRIKVIPAYHPAAVLRNRKFEEHLSLPIQIAASLNRKKGISAHQGPLLMPD